MDFELDEDLRDLRELAVTVLSDLADPARLRAVESSADPFDQVAYRTLAETGLLSVALPEECEGAGLGMDALAVVLEEQGRHVVGASLWNAVLASWTLASATREHDDLVRAFSSGGARGALALEEYGADPTTPTCRAVRAADGWRLSGTKALVPSAPGAAWFVVSAAHDEGTGGLGLFLVRADDVVLVPEVTSDHDVAGDLVLDATPGVLLAPDEDLAAAGALLELTLVRARVALAALQVGVGEGAMRIAARHVSERHQFGRPLGTFQAVQHQLADCWIDVDAIRLTTWQALSDLGAAGAEESLPVGAQIAAPSAAAVRASLVAQWWACQAGLDVVHRTQHVQGGLGVDVDHPAHRHYLWGRSVATTLGGAASVLQLLGSRLGGES